jgi:hypothetical protein
MIRVMRVRYKIGVWFSHTVDQKFNTVELARDYIRIIIHLKKYC